LWVENNVETDGMVTGCTFHFSLPLSEAYGPPKNGSEASTLQTVRGDL
jgi:hypothetical protein